MNGSIQWIRTADRSALKRRSLILTSFAILACGGLAHGQTLTVTNGLALWLKADSLALSDGQSVSTWTDSSTNGNNATQGTVSAQPMFHTGLFNGKPGVRFDGTSDFLALSRIGLPSGLTYFAVFRTTSTDSTRGYAGNAALTILGDNHPLFVYNGFGVTGGKGEFNAFDQPSGSGWEHYNSATTVNDGVARDMIATFASSDNTPRLYVNGLLEASGTTDYGEPFVGINRVGGGYLDGSGTGDLYDGDLAEILIYDTVLSGSDRQSAHEYLVAKYALPEPSAIALLAVTGVLLWRRR